MSELFPGAPTGGSTPLFSGRSSFGPMFGPTTFGAGVQSLIDPFQKQGSAGQLLNALQTGTVNLRDEDASVLIAPGGAFKLQDKSGFNVMASPQTKSVGIGIGSPTKSISIEGGFGAEPYARLGFQFGAPAAPVNDFLADDAAAKSVESAIPAQKESPTEPTAKEFLNRQISKYQEDNPYWYRP